MTKSWEEIWGEPGHATPLSWLVDTEVLIQHSDGQRESVTVKMMSRNEWGARIKRVVSLRFGYPEDSFDVISWEVEDEEEWD